MRVSGATEVLNLTLLSVGVMTNVLTAVLQPGLAPTQPLLPFNEALTDVLLGAWAKACTGTPVLRTIARHHRLGPGDPTFLIQHSTPETLVIQACTSKVNPYMLPITPPDREYKRLDNFGKRIFYSTSLALRSFNTACLFGGYSHSVGTQLCLC